MVFKVKYLFNIQLNTNWYWYQHPQHNVISVKIHTTLHPRLEVNAITDIHDIPKSVCNRTQEKSISRHPICLTDSDYDEILEEFGRQDKIYFERDIEVHSNNEET